MMMMTSSVVANNAPVTSRLYQMTGLNRRPRGWAHAAVTAGRACTPNKERYRGFLRLKALLIAATVAPSKTRKALVGAR